MRPRLLFLAICALLLAPLIATSAPAETAGGFSMFHTRCEYDITRMVSQVDPIGQPGVSPSSHLHAFYGYIRPTANAIANATLPLPDKPDPGFYVHNGISLIYPSSTCRSSVPGNWPAIWFPAARWMGQTTPAVSDPGKRTVAASWLLSTYRAPQGVHVLPAPYGMAMIVGNAHATSWASQDTAHVRWSCGDITPSYRKPVDCTDVGVVTSVVTLPDCWNGLHGWGNDSSGGDQQVVAGRPALLASGPRGWDATVPQPVDFNTPAGIARSNFAYSSAGACPDPFPFRIAQVILRQHFADPATNAPLVDPYVDNADGDPILRLRFSSGSAYTYHADYWALYNKSFYVGHVNYCLNGLAPLYAMDCEDGLK